MKKNLMILALGLAAVMPAKAQWNSWHTSSTISGVLGVANSAIESAERKKAMEIRAKEKLEYEQSFKDAMQSAKDYEGGEYWEDALAKYEEAARLNCNYGADYSKYRYVRENPVYVNKKNTNTKILRVACSDTETRLEMEVVGGGVNVGWNIKGKAYIKGNKGGKKELIGVENITMAPATVKIPWPGQKLRFALIFEALPEEAKEFDFIEPSTAWQFKDIKCK